MPEPTIYEGWAILELMGHRRLAGKVSEAEGFGGKMLRIDVPGVTPQDFTTQFYGVVAVYCLTPTTEAIARATAQHNRPEPVSLWELRAPIELPPQMESDYEHPLDDEP